MSYELGDTIPKITSLIQSLPKSLQTPMLLSISKYNGGDVPKPKHNGGDIPKPTVVQPGELQPKDTQTISIPVPEEPSTNFADFFKSLPIWAWAVIGVGIILILKKK